jgi:outer membrane autotransporter protein
MKMQVEPLRARRRARRHALLASTAILLTALAAPALADNECGIGATVTCTSAGNPYSSGITSDPVADLTVVVEDGVAITGGTDDAIEIHSADTVVLTLEEGSSIVTSGNYNGGIFLYSIDASVSVNSKGAITTTGRYAHGIDVDYNAASVFINSSGEINTSGDVANGIYVLYNYGAIIVDSATAITTLGIGANGISVIAAYETSISISNSGAITTSGSSSHGIYVYGSNWATNAPGANVTIATTAGSSITTSGQSAHGLYIYNASSGSLRDVSIEIAGTVGAQGTYADGISVRNALGPVKIDITGSVSGGAGIGSAIRIQGNTTVSIDNSGIIQGAIITGDGDDRFSNAGLLLTGYADFTGGSDTFINSGTLELAGSTGTIANLESFTNSGIVDLANGIAGDTLSISGSFVAAGGALRLDSDLASGTADVLTLVSVADTSDPTVVWGDDTAAVGAPLVPILLIEAAQDDSSGSAFVAAPFGAYQYELSYDSLNFDWYLQSIGIYPGTAEYPALVSGALLSFASDLSALHGRLHELHWTGNGDGPKIVPAAWTGAFGTLRPWVQLTGAKQEIDGDTSYDLGATKLEAGLDTTRRLANGDLFSFGAFAGSGLTSQDFSGSTTETDSNMFLAGLYGAWRSNSFYADAIAKYEHHAAELRSLATSGEGSSFSLDLLGLSLEGGHRLTFEETYLQPRVRLSFVHAWGESFEDASGATIDLDGADSLSGEIGARLGLTPRETMADLYVDLAVHHEVLGEARAEVSGLAFSDDLPGTTFRLASGMAWGVLGGKAILSLDAAYAIGSEAQELSATGALRVIY